MFQTSMFGFHVSFAGRRLFLLFIQFELSLDVVFDNDQKVGDVSPWFAKWVTLLEEEAIHTELLQP